MRRLPPWLSVALVIAVVVMHGCDQPGGAKKTSAPAAATLPPPPPPPPVVLPPPPTTQPPVAVSPPVDNTPVADPPPASANDAANTEAVKAGVGVGIKGRSLDPHEGALVTPAKAFFAVRERAVFDIQVPQALQFYKAENGAGPATHEEFMERIVKANGIKLPELPRTHVYRFDPQKEELQVIRPKM